MVFLMPEMKVFHKCTALLAKQSASDHGGRSGCWQVFSAYSMACVRSWLIRFVVTRRLGHTGMVAVSRAAKTVWLQAVTLSSARFLKRLLIYFLALGGLLEMVRRADGTSFAVSPSRRPIRSRPRKDPSGPRRLWQKTV